MDASEPDDAVSGMVAELVAEVSANMERNLDASSAAVRGMLEQHLPVMRGDRRWADLLRSSIVANVETILHALQHGIPADGIPPPAAAVEFARRMAQNAIPMEVLARSYRISLAKLHDQFLARLADAAAAGSVGAGAHEGRVHEGRVHEDEAAGRGEPVDAGVVLAAARYSVSVSHQYIDSVVAQLVVVYDAERERWGAGADGRRADRVRSILSRAGGPGDSLGEPGTAAGGRSPRDYDEELGYDLSHTHLAAVLWIHRRADDGPAALQRGARRLGTFVGPASRPLAIAPDETSLWAWYPVDPAGRSLQLSEVRARWDTAAAPTSEEEPPVSLALGLPAAGRAGFRRSHEHAVLTRSVSMQSDRAPGRATSYDEPGLSAAAMLCTDLPAAAVWVHETLGGLAGKSDAPARLRETVRRFYLHGSSHKAAAQALHLHPNTVKYRIRRAEELLGKPLQENRSDVELAVSICHWMGDRVLHAA